MKRNVRTPRAICLTGIPHCLCKHTCHKQLWSFESYKSLNPNTEFYRNWYTLVGIPYQLTLIVYDCPAHIWVTSLPASFVTLMTDVLQTPNCHLSNHAEIGVRSLQIWWNTGRWKQKTSTNERLHVSIHHRTDRLRKHEAPRYWVILSAAVDLGGLHDTKCLPC